MRPLFQLSTRKYDEEIILVKKAMVELEKNCKIKAPVLGQPIAI